MSEITNKTKLTFNISYDISSEEYAKLVNLFGSNIVLVPVLNDVDIFTYYKEGSSAQSSFIHLFTWGSSFDSNLFGSKVPQWDYGTGIATGTNTITYTTADWNNYIKSDTDLSLSSNIKFGVYKSTTSDNKVTPTGSRLTDIDYSDLVAVSCTFTEEA